MTGGDWKVGDLALCIADVGPADYWCPSKGRIYRVTSTADRTRSGHVMLELAEDPTPYSWIHRYFRKIQPDEPIACDAEFVRLLKSASQPVVAITKPNGPGEARPAGDATNVPRRMTND